MTEKAVILAAGVGRRMRRRRDVELSPEQRIQADAGLKALIPVGRPFLEYGLSALADAGVRRICLVVAPGLNPIRAHFGALDYRRLEVVFAVQAEPRGTADALLAAEEFVGSDPFVMVNSDNYYPPAVLRALCALREPALVAFRRRAFLASGQSNIGAERLAAYAVVQIDADGYLGGMLEKPDRKALDALQEPVYLSMNCWRFEPTIFDACRQVLPSPRGELELPGAVELAMRQHGTRFRVLTSDEPVLDLSERGDIPAVTRLLRDREVAL